MPLHEAFVWIDEPLLAGDCLRPAWRIDRWQEALLRAHMAGCPGWRREDDGTDAAAPVVVGQDWMRVSGWIFNALFGRDADDQVRAIHNPVPHAGLP